ncbi:MAG: protease modulator HflC [Nitrospinae bacterium]|nr:protease modulator HflC [Nitrospinota bacterium]
MVKNLGALIFIVLGFVAYTGFFTVDMTEQVVITQMGMPIRVASEPGLHFKIPFIQQTTTFSRQLLDYDANAAEIITSDKKNMLVDNFAKWKIVDPLLFLQTVRDFGGAQARLDDIIYSELRVELGRHPLHEIISTKRTQIMETVRKASDEKARAYGILINDVRIKRADMPPEIANSIYNRMKAERQRIAKEYRSEGNEEAMKIRAETDKQRIVLLAEAYKSEQEIKGQGDAEAVHIYALEFSKDPKFYEFIRSLEAYKKSLSDKTIMVLSPDSEFLKTFSSSK